MYDDRCLIDLINKRFDDTNAQIAALKADMLREVQALKAKHDEHEAHDTERFSSLSAGLSKFDRLSWVASGAAAVAFCVIQASWWAIKTYVVK